MNPTRPSSLPDIVPGKPFRFAVLGDLTAPEGRKGELGRALEIFDAGVRKIAAWHDEAKLAFVVGIGDFVHQWGPDWDTVVSLLEPLPKVPLLMVPGNHDIRSEETKAAWLSRWGHPKKGSEDVSVAYTNYLRGDALFVLMDTEDFTTGEWSHHRGFIGDEQAEQTLRALESPGWNLALILMHKPLWMSAHEPTNSETWRAIERAVDQAPGHLMIAGHTHKQSAEEAPRGTRYIVGAMGGRSFNGHYVTHFEVSANRTDIQYRSVQIG